MLKSTIKYKIKNNKMKKVLADFELCDRWGDKYYSLRIPIIKNYKGNLTKTKNYIPYSADKPYKKKIKKNDPLFEFALYDRKDTSQHGFFEYVLRKDKTDKAKKILIISPVSDVWRYEISPDASSGSTLGKIYSQGGNVAVLDFTSKVIHKTSKNIKKKKEENIDKANIMLQEKINKLKS